MKKLLLPFILVLIIGFAGLFVARFLIGGNEDTWICSDDQWVKHGNPKDPMPQNGCGESQKSPADTDMSTIRSFMAEPNLELSFINSDLPMPYFRVGKVTQMGNGENMEKVDGWVRQVNIYNQKDLLNGTCNIYEFHTDTRSHALTAVVIRGLRQNEIDTLKNNGTPCITSSGTMPKLTKSEAETIAFEYLKRAVPNFNQIKDQFAYSLQSNGEIQEWLWEDRSYTLPEGLASRPYSYPIIRISINGDKTIQYWNTISLFQNI